MMLFLFLVFSGTVLIVRSDEDCKGVEIVKREEWSAREPFRSFNVKLPLTHVIILHTVTRFCRSKLECIRRVRFIQDMHLDDRGWWDIAYSFLIGGDGRVYEGRGWDKSGAFSMGFNTKAVGIAFIGNFNKYEANEAMINATLNLLACGIEKGKLTPAREIHAHRDVACTESPGDYLYPIIRQWDHYKGGKMPDYRCEKLPKPDIEPEELDY